MSSVARIDAFSVRYPEPNDLDNLRCLTFVRLATADGVTGWGECITMWPEASKAAQNLIEEGLGPILKGRDPLDNGVLFAEMKEHCWWYGDTGLAMFALSALDIALWDLKGKLLGQPLHRLLGGKLHQHLRACASTHPSKPLIADLARELADHAAAGYTAVKVGFGKKGEANLGVDPKRDLEYVKAVREALGPDVDFIVDLGKQTLWDAPMAVKMTRAFEQFHIRWMEDPLPPTDIAGYKHLRANVQTPIASGEREWTVAGYRRLVEAGMADIYLVDPGRVEGVTGFWQVIGLTAAAHLQIDAHTWSSAINTAASLHLTACAPNYVIF